MRFIAQPILLSSTRALPLVSVVTNTPRKECSGRGNNETRAAARPRPHAHRIHPGARRWSLNFASLRDGALTPPVIGGFGADGRGVFYGDDKLGERPIRVRFVITPVSADEARFEQAFSADGGATWEVNWIAVDRRTA